MTLSILKPKIKNFRKTTSVAFKRNIIKLKDYGLNANEVKRATGATPHRQDRILQFADKYKSVQNHLFLKDLKEIEKELNHL